MSTEAITTDGRGEVATSARALNDTIAKGAKRLGGKAAPFEFFCECGDLGCRRMVSLTLAKYHRIPPGSVLAHPPAG